MKKSRISTVLLVFIFLIGLSLLLYPTVSDWWNSFHSTRAIQGYDETVSAMNKAETDSYRSAAVAYNQSLLSRANPLIPSDAEHAEYLSLLDVSGTGIMGYLEIPVIDCDLPFYHGVEENTLASAVGHIEGSSLPVGGESTHCVLSGHRGLPSAKLLTDLDQVVEGDVFYLHVLNETLVYEVDRILIVEPHETAALAIETKKDYCTLVTCTPYGINTHRLLVRGHRVDAADLGYVEVAPDAIQYEPVFIAPMVAVPILLILFIYVMVKKPKKKKEKEADV